MLIAQAVTEGMTLATRDASIALYDRRTGLLLTGDTLYPGRLYVRDGPAFAASIQRLVAFTRGSEGFFTPRVPVDGVVGVLAEVRARLGCEAVHVADWSVPSTLVAMVFAQR